MTGELGDFLRAGRSRVTPEQAGLRAAARETRRVPGLRREEVAMLAGLSMDYYTRLEQGRERRPSPQVLEALAAALRFDHDARAHLYRLAEATPVAREPRTDGIGEDLTELMAAWPNNPAVVFDRAYDVVAANPIADALFCGWRHSRNLLHVVFTDPAARTFYRDWPEVAADAVAGFRLGHGHDPGNPRVREVLADMLEASPEFARRWSEHRVRGKSLQRKHFVHPDVGPVELTMQAFEVRASPGRELVVYHAAAGSPSAEALALLGSLAASTETSEQRRL